MSLKQTYQPTSISRRPPASISMFSEKLRNCHKQSGDQAKIINNACAFPHLNCLPGRHEWLPQAMPVSREKSLFATWSLTSSIHTYILFVLNKINWLIRFHKHKRDAYIYFNRHREGQADLGSEAGSLPRVLPRVTFSRRFEETDLPP